MKTILFLSLLISLASCRDETEQFTRDSDLVEISFRPNACSEIWDREPYIGGAITDRMERMKKYLADQGITRITGLKTSEPDDLNTCKACTCLVNYIIFFSVSRDDYSKLKKTEPFSTYLK